MPAVPEDTLTNTLSSPELFKDRFKFLNIPIEAVHFLKL